jgi:hypothetical protein
MLNEPTMKGYFFLYEGDDCIGYAIYACDRTCHGPLAVTKREAMVPALGAALRIARRKAIPSRYQHSCQGTAEAALGLVAADHRNAKQLSGWFDVSDRESRRTGGGIFRANPGS